MRTKAVIPVHMHGFPANLSSIFDLCKKSNLVLNEDNCQSLGATFDGKYLGTIGDMGCISLDFAKVITSGEGGIIVTNNEKHHNLESTF